MIHVQNKTSYWVNYCQPIVHVAKVFEGRKTINGIENVDLTRAFYRVRVLQNTYSRIIEYNWYFEWSVMKFSIEHVVIDYRLKLLP